MTGHPPPAEDGDHVRGIFTVTAACAGCGACLRTCPEHAIRPAAPGAPAPLVVLPQCTGCGECAEVCPVEACVELEATLPVQPAALAVGQDQRSPRP